MGKDPFSCWRETLSPAHLGCNKVDSWSPLGSLFGSCLKISCRFVVLHFPLVYASIFVTFELLACAYNVFFLAKNCSIATPLAFRCTMFSRGMSLLLQHLLQPGPVSHPWSSRRPCYVIQSLFMSHGLFACFWFCQCFLGFELLIFSF